MSAANHVELRRRAVEKVEDHPMPPFLAQDTNIPPARLTRAVGVVGDAHV